MTHKKYVQIRCKCHKAYQQETKKKTLSMLMSHKLTQSHTHSLTKMDKTHVSLFAMSFDWQGEKVFDFYAKNREMEEEKKKSVREEGKPRAHPLCQHNLTVISMYDNAHTRTTQTYKLNLTIWWRVPYKSSGINGL